jgi:hypothetical protein
VLLSVELCVTLKTYLKGAPFYNAWESRALCGISKRESFTISVLGTGLLMLGGLSTIVLVGEKYRSSM